MFQVLAMAGRRPPRSPPVLELPSQTEAASPALQAQREPAAAHTARRLFAETGWHESEDLLADDPRLQTGHQPVAIDQHGDADRVAGWDGGSDDTSERGQFAGRGNAAARPPSAGTAGGRTAAADAARPGEHGAAAASGLQRRPPVVISPLQPTTAAAAPPPPLMQTRPSVSSERTRGRRAAQRRPPDGAASAPDAAAVGSVETAAAALAPAQTMEAAAVAIGRRTSSRRVRAPDKFSPSKADASLKRRRSGTPAATDRQSVAASSSDKRRRAATASAADPTSRTRRSPPSSASRRRSVKAELGQDSDVIGAVVVLSEDDGMSSAVTPARSSTAGSVASAVSGTRGRGQATTTATDPTPGPVTRATRRSAAVQSADQSRSATVARPTRGRRANICRARCQAATGTPEPSAEDGPASAVGSSAVGSPEDSDDTAPRRRGRGRRRVVASSVDNEAGTAPTAAGTEPPDTVSDVLEANIGERRRHRIRQGESSPSASAAAVPAYPVKDSAVPRGRGGVRRRLALHEEPNTAAAAEGADPGRPADAANRPRRSWTAEQPAGRRPRRPPAADTGQY